MKKIDDIEPTTIERMLQVGAKHIQEAKQRLAETTPIVMATSDRSEIDFNYARDNLYKLIEHGEKAIQELTDFARQSGHPRAYEVVATLIKTLSEANKNLIDLHKLVRDVQKTNDGGGKLPPKSVTNNAIFIGTNAELNDVIKGITGEKK